MLTSIDPFALQNAIKELIEARFDAISAVKPEPPTPDHEPSHNKRPATNGTSDVGSDPSASPEPARKKAKRSSSVEDSDARLAAQLQAQENRLARGRSTRGGGEKKVTKKKAPRKKSAKKVGADDDSDLDGSEAPVKRKAGGGFQKPFNLSPALQALCGETQVCTPLSRGRAQAYDCEASPDICATGHTDISVLAVPSACRQEFVATHKGQ